MNLLDMSAEQIMAVSRWTVEDLPMGPGQRIAIFEKPDYQHNYVLGVDFAQGMQAGDFDAVAIFDRNVAPWRQVAVAHGRWGPTVMPKLLYALQHYYNGCFIVGERQVGLAVLRTLVDDFGITYLFYEKDEKKVSKPISDRLGHWTQENDITLTDLRRAVRDAPKHQEIVILDGPTLLELEKMEFRSRSAKTQQAMLAGRTTVSDHLLKASAPPKYHDDLVIATALALKGLKCVGEYESDKPAYAPGTYGYYANPEELLEKQDEEMAAEAAHEVADKGVFNRFLHGG